MAADPGVDLEAIAVTVERCADRARAFKGDWRAFVEMDFVSELHTLGHKHAVPLVRALISYWCATQENAVGGSRWDNDPEYRVRLMLTQHLSGFIGKACREGESLIDEVCRWMSVQAGFIPYSDELERTTYGLIFAHAKKQPLSAAMTEWLRWARSRWATGHKPNHSMIAQVDKLLGEEQRLMLEPGEAWADAAIADINAGPHGAAWGALVAHCRAAKGSVPAQKWAKVARELLQSIGEGAFAESLVRWLPLVDKPRTTPWVRRSPYEQDPTDRIIEPHMDILKGLCWIGSGMARTDLARALGRLALSGYRKVPGVGSRAVRVGNAAVYALGQMPGMDAVGQLAMLRVKVKFGSAQIGIEKALSAAAEREGLPREEIDELGVPSYGLTEVGKRAEAMGEFTAELAITGIGDTELRFLKKDGKPQKSVPAALKEQFAEELKELKGAAKDIGAMLPAQRDRLDSLFLQDKTWEYPTWRERYLDHPLVGVLSRRLIWMFRDSPGETWRAATYDDPTGTLIDAFGKSVTVDAGHAAVRLWHPIEAPGGTDGVLAWRRFFEDRQIRQPFKQAHREIYVLTDAERNTRTYSNRYAAHVIRQHQFNALCGVRGWKNKLRLMVDAEYPPATRPLPAWSLRAEYWVEGAGGEYGTDTNESGVYHLLTTDQVRFYALDAAQASAHAGGGGYGAHWGRGDLAPGAPLDSIPALVFSEIMRDVDLFVGVCSVANNPEWNDGGPGGTHREYWWTTSFADLTASGVGRRELLERLVPRLKIATLCSLDKNFLHVRGKIRTYKIHLGSGNILMLPNDQYLCIVPSARGEAGGPAAKGVFLPFEGDRMLSVILSKAFMLAEDDKIEDETITRQIGKR